MSVQTTTTEGKGLFGAWDWFWFQPRNPATLGMIRIFTGLILLYIHFCYTFDLMDFVHPERAWIDAPMYRSMREDGKLFAPSDEWNSPRIGPDGRPAPGDPYFAKYRLAFGQYLWSIYFHIHDGTWIWVIHFAFLGILILFTLGLWTRVTTVLAWIITLQYIHRSPTTLFGMDTMTTLGLFYLMIGPGGACYSLDHWLAQRRERIRRNDPTYQLAVPTSLLANISIRMIQIQFCIMYMAAGLSKLLGPSWWNGTALWNTVANYEFAPYYLSFYEPALRMLASYRPIWEVSMTAGVIFTLVLEIGFPFLVWIPRFRWICVIGAVMLHTGIGLLMGLITFSLMMIVLVSSFIPSETVEQTVNQLWGYIRSPNRPGPPLPTPVEPARKELAM